MSSCDRMSEFLYHKTQEVKSYSDDYPIPYYIILVVVLRQLIHKISQPHRTNFVKCESEKYN